MVNAYTGGINYPSMDHSWNERTYIAEPREAAENTAEKTAEEVREEASSVWSP